MKASGEETNGPTPDAESHSGRHGPGRQGDTCPDGSNHRPRYDSVAFFFGGHMALLEWLLLRVPGLPWLWKQDMLDEFLWTWEGTEYESESREVALIFEIEIRPWWSAARLRHELEKTIDFS